MTVMLTYKQCVAKVSDMEMLAIALPQHRDAYVQLAVHWRWVADTAKWQEAYEDRFL
jgi:hypothetical protein